MTQFYSDTAGTLVIDQLTPVIEALFSNYCLETIPLETGEFVFGAKAEESSLTWQGVNEGLLALTKALNIPVSEKDTGTLIGLLAEHLEVEDSPLLDGLVGREFEDSIQPELGELFDLAQLLNDGHGLKAIKASTAYYSNKMLPGDFGGYGEYVGKHFSVWADSRSAADIGCNVEKALEAGDVDAATQVFGRVVQTLLSNLLDSEMAAIIRARLGNSLLQIDQDGTTPSAWYAVTGSIPGVDADKTLVVLAESPKQAVNAFESMMYAEQPDPETLRERTVKEHGQSIIVNSIVVSDSPITQVC